MKKFMAVVTLLLLVGCGSTGSQVYYSGEPYYPSQQHSQNQICDRRVDYPMAPLPAGMCNDPRHPGSMVQESFLINNPRYACCGEVWANGVDPRAPRPAVQIPAAPVQKQEAPRNKFERPENRRKRESEEGALTDDIPTVEDYMSPKWKDVIPENCKKGNFGHDSDCLYEESKTLRKKRNECENDVEKCSSKINYGEKAKVLRNLSDELRRSHDD